MSRKRLEIEAKSREIRNGKWGFHFLLLTSYFLLLTLFIPEDALAGAMYQKSRLAYMPKYSLWGHIALQYEAWSIGKGGFTGNTRRFTQNYRLNFMSYVMSPRIMYYTITTGLDIGSGRGTPSTITKSYGLETVFFPYQPISFSLRASRMEGMDYERSNYGLSATYTRRIRAAVLRGMRAPRVPVEEEEDINKDINRNVNVNRDVNTNVNVNLDTNENIQPKPRPRKKLPSSNLFSDILPRTTALNIDRTTMKERGLKTLWNNANLRFRGKYATTEYGLGLDYNDWRNNSGAHKGFGSDLSTSTGLNWSFFQRFDNYIYFRKNDIKSYNIFSLLSGSGKGWNYGISANYSATSNGEKAHTFNFEFNLSRAWHGAYPFVFKGIEFNYSFNLGISCTKKQYDLWAGTTLRAHKRFALNTDLNSTLSITAGRLGTTLDFQTGINYIFRPRKEYAVRVEFDPQSKTLKTHILKPQVYGWDYSIRTGYAFGLSKSTGQRSWMGWGSVPPGIRGATARSSKTSMSHRADLNINVYLRGVNISSDAVLYYWPYAGKSFQWNNSIYTTVMRRIGVTLGTGLTIDMPQGANITKIYSIYNLITYSPWRNAFLRVTSRYIREMPADTTTIEVGPSLSWRWGRIFMDLEITLTKYKSSSGAESVNKRIMMRATRPFRIL